MMAPYRVTSSEYASRIRALLGKGGITIGFPRKQRDRWILLHAAARSFGLDERLTEIEATQRIGGFLMSNAPHWRVDRVTIRRALVDEGFLDRDSGGVAYRKSDRYERRVRFDEAPEIEKIIGSFDAPPAG